ncbi:MAG: response regulator transcription factor [SAR202 cluster bacterium]|nr:response regulator transcription factor [SAR202 cluster bacterium]|tara:strand:- start:4372 stop:5094 length:723 start_codon:yes stop_codon:yes gene_type:complete
MYKDEEREPRISDEIKTILVVEDDFEQANIIRNYLESADYSVLLSRDGVAGLEQALKNSPDLVVLDVMLPGISGIDICREIKKQKNVPVIMVTALGSEEATVEGFEVGADDYIAKPYRPRELVARIGSLINRYRRVDNKNTLMGVPGLEVDIARHQVKVDGIEVVLSAREFEILAVIIAEPGRVFPRSQLLELAFGFDYQGLDRTVDAHMGNLREKLGDDPKEPRFIETVYGVGYRVIDA